jgi:phosphohistidine swiveling domain-containing protein
LNCWISLDEAAARDPAVAGAKAAGLARARAAGLPVLPGAVLPVDASASAMRAGAEALRRSSSPAAAYLGAIAAGADTGIEPPAGLGEGPWVVRSSTPLDDDGRWSGAFASYLDVMPSDLATSARGCWASAFGHDAVARCEAAGHDVGSILVGVLVQPFVRFTAGGIARVARDGTVAVTAARGGPAGVVARGDGRETLVGPDGRADRPAPPGVGEADVRAAATVARAAAVSTGASSIEWGAAAGAVSLLQLGPRAAPAATPKRSPRVEIPEGAERLARLVSAFPGPLGLELVLPWALGADAMPSAVPPHASADADTFSRAMATAVRLASEVWSTDASEVRARMEEFAHLVGSGRPDDALHLLRDLRRPDPGDARSVLAAVAAVGERLVHDGRLPAAPLVWRLTPDEVALALRGAAAPVRRGPDRWEPFVAEVVRSRGTTVTATSVSPGVGAGPVYRVERLSGAFRPVPRSVLVVPRPLPHLAPLLWHSAGLVSLGGTTGAHLFEVARSLGVPAVTGIDGEKLATGALLAVDGDAGAVSVLPDGAAPTERATPDLVGARPG